MFTIVWYNELFFMQQLIRYGLVGLASNLAIYCIYLLLTYLGVEPKAAMTLVYMIGATIGFVGNRKWTFSHQGDAFHSAIRYMIAHFAGYLLNFLILFIFVDKLGYIHQAVQAAAIIVVAGFLFIIFKYYVFHEKTQAPEII